MRNRNIDVVRGIALLWVMIYHIWVLSGSAPIGNVVIYDFVKLGGEIGVTIFFVLSGYGIYNSLKNTENSGKISFFPFLGKRLKRVVPEYWLSIFIVLFFTAGAEYISKPGLKDIGLHMVFLHNLSPNTVSSINGVLWTMAVIVQFYVIAIPMFLLLKKSKFIFPIIFIAITVGFKFIAFHYLGHSGDFWASRETIFSSLDNFALGMFAAWLMERKFLEKTNKKPFNIAMMVLSVVLLFVVCDQGLLRGIHVDNLSGYFWHTLVALLVTMFVFFYGRKELLGNHIIKRGIVWLSKYEYGIYIVHLLMIQYLLAYSTIFQKLAMYPPLKYISLLAVTIFGGWVLCKCGDGLRTVFSKKKV